MSEQTAEVIDSRLQREELEARFKELEQKGFYRWPVHISLTSTVFTDEAMFKPEEIKTVEEAKEEVRNEAKRQSGLDWEVEVVVERFDQNQRRAHAFIKEKVTED